MSNKVSAVTGFTYNHTAVERSANSAKSKMDLKQLLLRALAVPVLEIQRRMNYIGIRTGSKQAFPYPPEAIVCSCTMAIANPGACHSSIRSCTCCVNSGELKRSIIVS